MYRKKFGLIANDLKLSTFYKYMTKAMDNLNLFMSIIGRATNTISKEDCGKARKALDKFDQYWKEMTSILGVSNSLGCKYHYLMHCVEYCELWGIPLGYISEQSIESFHKVCSMVWRRYLNQRGKKIVELFIKHLLLVTSPTYQE